MKNKLGLIENILFNELERLDNNDILENLNEEIARSTAIAKVTQQFVSSVNTNLKVYSLSDGTAQDVNRIEKIIGINGE